MTYRIIYCNHVSINNVVSFYTHLLWVKYIWQVLNVCFSECVKALIPYSICIYLTYHYISTKTLFMYKTILNNITLTSDNSCHQKYEIYSFSSVAICFFLISVISCWMASLSFAFSGGNICRLVLVTHSSKYVGWLKKKNSPTGNDVYIAILPTSSFQLPIFDVIAYCIIGWKLKT